MRHARLQTIRRVALWAVAGVTTMIIVVQPVGTRVQMTLALSAIALMAALWLFAKGPLARMLFLATGSLIILRYLYWRTTSTLPSIDAPVSFAFAIILFMAELYCVAFLAIALVINAEPLTRGPASPQDDANLPSVDILIPSYNEDESILAVTLSAARAIDYPKDKLRVWLLDDGGTDQKCASSDPIAAQAARDRRKSLMALCHKNGATYVTRARNEHAKAGNLNAGLAASHGEIVVVLDADHVPFRCFLRETIGYFADDAKLFLVQTPHVFLNPDPVEKNLSTFDRMPSENEMFYSITQRGLDKWNGSFFCGSAALLRRAALNEAGGFAGLTITEDCETAFELHAKGWTSVYVDKPLIAGLQPETFASFIGQRARWCQGMFQILLLKNPLFKAGLKPIQRVAYLSSMMFWMFPLPRLIFMAAPLLHIFFDVRIFTSSLDETIAYTASYVGVNIMLQSYLFGHVRWPWMSELYEYMQGMFLVRSIASVLIAPRRPVFNVTAKGQSLDQDHLSELAMPFAVVFVVLAAGVVTAGYRYLYDSSVSELMLVVGIWAAINLGIAGVALGAVAERKQVDRTPRLAIDRRGSLVMGDAEWPVTINDVSADGCAITLAASTAPHPLVERDAMLTIVPFDPACETRSVAVRLVRSTGNLYGLTFDRASPDHLCALTELMYADSGAIARFLLSRRQTNAFVGRTLQFAIWSVTGPIRALHYWRIGQSTVVTPIAAPIQQAFTPIVTDAPSLIPAVASALHVVPAAENSNTAALSPVMQAMLLMAASELKASTRQAAAPERAVA
jgi:cellulose synthase (UDP-forming)